MPVVETLVNAVEAGWNELGEHCVVLELEMLELRSPPSSGFRQEACRLVSMTSTVLPMAKPAGLAADKRSTGAGGDELQCKRFQRQVVEDESGRLMRQHGAALDSRGRPPLVGSPASLSFIIQSHLISLG